MHRRNFIKSTIIGIGAASASQTATFSQTIAARRSTLVDLSNTIELQPALTQTWLGTDCWANRLQDWRLNNGRIECLEGGAEFEVRTVSLLSRFLEAEHRNGRIQVTLGLLTPGKPGFAGLLLGAGAGELEHLSSALTQRASGEGGGLMAVVDHQGNLSFRDFSSNEKPLSYAQFSPSTSAQQNFKQTPKSSKWILDCHIDAVANDAYDLRLSLLDQSSGNELSFATLTGIEPKLLQGGLMLVSSPNQKHAGARWWFKNIKTGGDKVGVYPDRQLGPVVGAMHSLDCADNNLSTLRLSVQLMPIALSNHPTVTLRARKPNTKEWQISKTSSIHDGFVALFEIEQWDATKDWEYQVSVSEHRDSFVGTIPAGTGNDLSLKVALFSCILPTAKSLDHLDYSKLIPQEAEIGRYTKDNILFPHTELVENCRSHSPDLYVFCGDQYYETYPTRAGRHTDNAKLDTLYRWYLWYLSFREVLRNRPSILLADDHDVLQGNLWGNAGEEQQDNREESGGFKWGKDLIKMIYRIQHGHNPRAYDPRPIAHGIPVSYSAFKYRGTSFALLEDRKFKTPPDYESTPSETTGDLLGKAQEAFLKEWAHEDTHLPKICIASSMWGSAQTDAKGEALLDYDANGYPPDGRSRAVRLAAEAQALVIAGDQHLGMLAHQGLSTHNDGVLFFAGPAAAAFWQRWFEPKAELTNQRDQNRNTGDFVDTFGNKMRVLAVANPKISHAEFDASTDHWGKFIADHRLKSEGFGIIDLDFKRHEFVIECWPGSKDENNGQQFSGWPYRHPFKRNKD